MAPLNGLANALRSMARKATLLRQRNTKSDNPISESESEYETDDESDEELSQTPSKLKYDFQDPTGPPGQLYRGEFKGSKKHGSGTMSFAQNDDEARFMYKGDFVDDKMQGSGVLDWHDGKTYKGQFENNKLHGEGVMTWPDGRKYIGHYVKGVKEGLGTVQYPNGSSKCGQFKKGKLHGEIVYTNKHGIEKLVRFVHGKPYHCSVIGEGAASDLTTEASSICSARRSIGTSGHSSNGPGVIGAGIASMLDDMQNGEPLGDDMPANDLADQLGDDMPVNDEWEWGSQSGELGMVSV